MVCINTCEKCGKEFPNYIKIDGKVHSLHGRKYCLECSPFGKHNTKKITKQYCCTRCGDTNPEHFTKGRYTECKKCRSLYNKKVLRNNKKYIISYLGGKCICCGYHKFDCALDVHHLDLTKKNKKISAHAKWNWEKLKAELENCVLLCSNCHRAVHAGLINIEEYLSQSKYSISSIPKYEEVLLQKNFLTNKVKNISFYKLKYSQLLKKVNEKKIVDRKRIIENVNLDYSKFGWISKLELILGIKSAVIVR